MLLVSGRITVADLLTQINLFEMDIIGQENTFKNSLIIIT